MSHLELGRPIAWQEKAGDNPMEIRYQEIGLPVVPLDSEVSLGHREYLAALSQGKRPKVVVVLPRVV